MAGTGGAVHRQGVVEMLGDGENHLLRLDEAGMVTLGRDVSVEPEGEGFRLSSPHVPGTAIVGPGTVAWCEAWTVDIHAEVARLLVSR